MSGVLSRLFFFFSSLFVSFSVSPGDLYVHADMHGASSVVVKNPSGMYA